MSLLDKQGALEALTEWNAARAARVQARQEYETAREKNWAAHVRMARAHKNAIETVAPEYRGAFLWFAELDGDRDQIIESADRAGSV